MSNMEELFKTINIIFKQPRQELILALEGIVKTEIVFTKPFNTPMLVVTYRGLKQEFFSFINIDEAQKLKTAIDEKRDFILLESI